MPRKTKAKTTSITQGIKPTLKDMSNMQYSSVSNQNSTLLENKLLTFECLNQITFDYFDFE